MSTAVASPASPDPRRRPSCDRMPRGRGRRVRKCPNPRARRVGSVRAWLARREAGDISPEAGQFTGIVLVTLLVAAVQYGLWTRDTPNRPVAMAFIAIGWVVFVALYTQARVIDRHHPDHDEQGRV